MNVFTNVYNHFTDTGSTPPKLTPTTERPKPMSQPYIPKQKKPLPKPYIPKTMQNVQNSHAKYSAGRIYKKYQPKKLQTKPPENKKPKLLRRPDMEKSKSLLTTNCNS